jgi:hypothetical protein
MMRNSQDFAETYSKMSDDELLRIEADRESLVEEAKLALEWEIQKRRISMSNDPQEVQVPAEVSEGAPIKAASSWWGRLMVFITWSTAGLTFILVAFGRDLKGEAAGAFAYHTTQMFLNLALAGWALTWVIAGRWLTIKRTMIIATVMYVIVIGWFAINLLH